MGEDSLFILLVGLIAQRLRAGREDMANFGTEDKWGTGGKTQPMGVLFPKVRSLL